MRIALHHFRLQPHLPQQIRHARSTLIAIHRWKMNFQRLADDLKNRKSRIQRTKRVLKNHLHPPPVAAELSLAQRKNRISLVNHLACCRRNQLQQRAANGRLSTPALAHKSHRRPRFDGETHIIHRLHIVSMTTENPRANREPDFEIADFEQRHTPCVLRSHRTVKTGASIYFKSSTLRWTLMRA